MLQVFFAILPLTLAAPFERATSQVIAAGRDGLCLSLAGGKGTTPSNGVAVISLPCDQASLWDINRGSGSVLISGTGFALDAGTNPGNNGALKVWQSYPGLYQQTWYYTDDNRIAITGGTQCLDEGTNGIQTYTCTTGNTNQIFFARQAGVTPPPVSSSVVPPPVSSTSSAPPPPPSQSSTTDVAPYIPKGTVYPDPPNAKRIHPASRPDLCFTAANADSNDGSLVQISYCFANDARPAVNLFQYWQTPAVGTSGPITLLDKCLDAGTNPSNGGVLKLWTCYPSLSQQTWTINADGTFRLANDQCADIQRDSMPVSGPLYGKELTLQTWTCGGGNIQQQFAVGT